MKLIVEEKDGFGDVETVKIECNIMEAIVLNHAMNLYADNNDISDINRNIMKGMLKVEPISEEPERCNLNVVYCKNCKWWKDNARRGVESIICPINRSEVLKGDGYCYMYEPLKVGHWIDSSNGWMCSECKRDNIKDTKYCPNCLAMMIDKHTSEEGSEENEDN